MNLNLAPARKRSLSVSVSRVFDMLELLSMHPSGLTQREIVEKLDIPKSSASVMIQEMSERHYLHLDPERRLYFLGGMIYRLGATDSQSNELETIARPVMGEIHRLTGEVVNLSVLEGRDVVLIGRFHSTHPLRFVPRLGSRVPAHVSAAGKSILAAKELSELESMYRGYRFECVGPRSICSFSELLAALEPVRVAGVAFDEEESHQDIVAIGGAIFGAGDEPLGAVSIVMPAYRVNSRLRGRLAELVKVGATLVSQACGYPPAFQKKYTLAHLARLWAQSETEALEPSPVSPLRPDDY